MSIDRRESRSEQALEVLLRALAAGQWAAESPLPPTRVLEKQFGVSHATMIKVLRMAADEGLLTVAPRQPAVVRAAAVTRARDMLHSLSRQRAARRLAILIPERIWPPDEQSFYSELKPEIDAEAARTDWVVDPVRWPALEQSRFIEELSTAGFTAALAAGISTDYIESLHLLQHQRFPTVLWNCNPPQIPLPAILLDEAGGAQQIARTLADLGHRNLCLATWSVDTRVRRTGHRVTAWLDYLAESGLLETCSLPILHMTRTADERTALADGILAAKMRPTAIVFAYAAAALQFLSVPAHRVVRIPEHLSVATFGQTWLSTETEWSPPLTTVWYDTGELARCTMAMVGELCDGRTPENVTMPMHVRVTASIGPPRSTEPDYMSHLGGDRR